MRFVVIPLLVTAGCFVVFLAAGRRVAVEPRGTPRGARDHRLRLRDVSLRGTALRGAVPLSRAGRTRGRACARERWIGCSRSAVGGVLVFVADILAGAVAYQDQWIDRWLASRLDPVGGRRDPCRRYARAARRDRRNARRGAARAALVAAARTLRSGSRGHGRARPTPAKSVPLPRDLDVAALGPRDGPCFPDAARGAGSAARCRCAACSTR